MITSEDKSGNPSLAPIPNIHPISNVVALRVHSDTEPKNMKTAQLQKGLILLYKGSEVIGEGIGFGVPIAKYFDETVFSGSSSLTIWTQENIVEIRKKFIMDLVTRNKIRNFNLENPKIRKLLDYISTIYKKQYQNHLHFAQYALLTRSLLFKLGVKSTFIKRPSKGSIVVTYVVNRNQILVKMDLRSLERNNLTRIFVLNEQGAHFFRTYSDSENLKLDNEAIGAWNVVTSQTAKITNEQDTIGFSLKTIKGTKLRRGRELIKDSLDWIGLDYELSAEYSQFEYEIEIFG